MYFEECVSKRQDGQIENSQNEETTLGSTCPAIWQMIYLSMNRINEKKEAVNNHNPLINPDHSLPPFPMT